jgi:hypothetical protein
MNYYQILDAIKQAKSQADLLETRREANAALLEGNLTRTEEALILLARGAMRKALACSKFSSVAALEEAFAAIHKDDPIFGDEVNAKFFFMWVLVERRMELFKTDHIRFGPLSIEVYS